MTRPRILTAIALVLIAVGAIVFSLRTHEDAKASAEIAHTEVTQAAPTIVIREPSSRYSSDAESAAVVNSQPPLALERLDWRRLLRESTDYFDFVKRAAAAALRGDGRAALYVAQALHQCREVIDLYERAATEPGFDPRKFFMDEFQSIPAYTPRMSEVRAAKFDRCARLVKENVFAGLDIKKEDGYSPDFWEKLALDLNDPLAKADRTRRNISELSRAAQDQKDGIFKEIREYSRDVIRSKDPQALFSLGFGLNSTAFGKNAGASPQYGLGLMLAACELGAECSLEDLGWLVDLPRGSELLRDANVSATDAMRMSMDPGQYERAYKNAQDIKEMLSRDDFDALERLFRIARP